MSMPIDIFWHSRQLSPLPILEFYANIQDPLMITKYVESYFYLYTACKMIKRIEKYNGIIIEPQLSVPNKQNIFFTAQFESYNELNNFLDSMGWKRIV